MEHKFLDPLHRVSEKPNHLEFGITDNPLLFSGEYYFLKCHRLSTEELQHVEDILSMSIIERGLYRRHPEDFQKDWGIPYNIVSHDEYVGVLLLSHVLGIAPGIAQCICNYGINHGWQFYCYEPGKNFWTFFKEHPIQAIKERLDYMKDYKIRHYDTNDVDISHRAEVVALTFTRSWRDRAFYKLLSFTHKPTLFEIVFLSLSNVFTTRRELHNTNGGTMLLALFRIALLEKEIRNLPFLVKLSHKFFKYRMTKKFGKDYPVVLAKHYFKYTDSMGNRHPIIELMGSFTF